MAFKVSSQSTRANLLRPFSFLDKRMKVLELGAGCGALTRYFGENCHLVDAIEGSYVRASIARERCSDLDNVKIFVSDIFNLSFQEEYDIVSLIGVLEYAPLFYPGKDNEEEACLKLLQLATSALKNDGIMIIAIENKLGLKYFSGCKEDHTGKMFDGIYGYPKSSKKLATPLTFSKKELEAMINQVGYEWKQFYYPFPDYKLPNTIIKEDQIYNAADYFLYNWVTTPFEDYSSSRDFIFQESLVLKNIAKAGLFGDHANSFLVLAGKQKPSFVDQYWIAKRYSIERKPQYATETTMRIDPKLKIEKRFLNSDDKNSIKEPIELKELDEEWVPGDLLVLSYYESLASATDPISSIVEMIEPYYKKLITSYGCVSANDNEGYPLLNGLSFDYMPWNIIVNGDNWFYIDKEWMYHHDLLTVDFVIYRLLHHLLERQSPYLQSGIEEDNFITKIINHFFPNYNYERNCINRDLESNIQDIISGPSIEVQINKQRAENRIIKEALITRDQHVADLENTLKDNKEIIQSLSCHISKLELETLDRDNELQEKEQSLTGIQRELQEKEQSLTGIQRELQEKEQSLTGILNSKTWRIAQRVHMLLAPRGSHRERLLKLAFNGMYILKKEGVSSFLIRSTNKVFRIEKMRDLWFRKAYNGIFLNDLVPITVEVGKQDARQAVRWISTVQIEDKAKQAFLTHPPARVTFRIKKVQPLTVFRSFIALLPEMWGRNPGGVQFRISIMSVNGDTKNLSRLSNPTHIYKHRHWLELRLDLQRFMNRDVDLTLSTSVPDGISTDYAWAVWGDPVLLSRKPFREIIGRGISFVKLYGAKGLWSKFIHASEIQASFQSTSQIIMSQPTQAPDWIMQEAPTLTLGEEDLWSDYCTLSRKISAQRQKQIESITPKPSNIISIKDDQLSVVAKSLQFTAVDKPDATIIIPAYNNIKLTIECLKTISQNTQDVSYEILIIDDGSKDDTQEILSSVCNIFYVRNQENLGFNASCNRAAGMARGEYLVFLNNDVQVKDNWLCSLLETFNKFDSVGAVGPRVLYPDGRLQEAGMLANEDASTKLIGLFDDPELPRYNYTREVDCCSGVCLVVPKKVFLDIGGFDVRYAPAYYEDTDLCFEIRRRGMHVYYNPNATIVHYLSATSDAIDVSFKLQSSHAQPAKVSRKMASADFRVKPYSINCFLSSTVSSHTRKRHVVGQGIHRME